MSCKLSQQFSGLFGDWMVSPFFWKILSIYIGIVICPLNALCPQFVVVKFHEAVIILAVTPGHFIQRSRVWKDDLTTVKWQHRLIQWGLTSQRPSCPERLKHMRWTKDCMRGCKGVCLEVRGQETSDSPKFSLIWLVLMNDSDVLVSFDNSSLETPYEHKHTTIKEAELWNYSRLFSVSHLQRLRGQGEVFKRLVLFDRNPNLFTLKWF